MASSLQAHVAAIAAALACVVACGKASAPDLALGADGGVRAQNDKTRGSAPEVGADGCPKDLLAAVGSKCGTAGQTCAAGPGPQHRLLMCSGGVWVEMAVSSPPPPSSAAPPTR